MTPVSKMIMAFLISCSLSFLAAWQGTVNESMVFWYSVASAFTGSVAMFSFVGTIALWFDSGKAFK